MAAIVYKLWGFGSPLQDGVSGSYHVGVAAVAKKSNINEPNIVINEHTCNLIARALFLPCPPGILLDHNNETYFCSMNFNLSGQALPPTPIAAVLARHRELCWGILLFDILMMNQDRHNRNLSYDRNTYQVQIFDHSRAFLPLKADIDSVIKDNTGKLGLVGHCLQSEIDSMVGFDEWCERIKSLPDYVIDETVAAICEIGFPTGKTVVAADFLKSRRDGIDVLVTSNIGQFPKLPQPAVAAALPAAAPANPPGPQAMPAGGNP